MNEEDLPEGVKAGVHAPRGAEEPPGQESEGPYERRSACNGRGAKGPREVDGVKLTQPERTPATLPQGYARRRGPRPLGLDRTDGVDRSHADGARTGCERRRLVQPDYHQRWPNAFFAAQGLYSLTTAHVASCQSVRR